MAQQNRQNNQAQQVAVIEPQRMQMPANVVADYGLNEDTWRALTDAVFPLAKSVGAVVMALAYCKKRNLDVFARVVHIVPMQVGNRTVETVWPGIGLLRITAQRQADFDGWDDCEFGPDKTLTFKGKRQKWENGQRAGYEDVQVTVTVPEWARFTFYKIRNGRRMAMPGPKTYFTESFSPISAYCNVPNARWERAPRQMLEKNAEAAALRRGWPDVFGDESTAEEMEGRSLSVDAEFSEVPDGQTSTDQKPATPTREQFNAAAQVEDAEPESDGTEEDGPTLAEQAAGHDASDGTSDGSTDDTSPEQKDQPAEREVWDKPPEHDDWPAWQAAVSSLLKTAANIAKLDKVVNDHNEVFEHAPDDVREWVQDLYQEKRQDHIEAMR
jgi:phage recombination protein Bet